MPDPLKKLKIRIGNILLWKGMLWAKEMGCHFLDMGGSAEDVDKSNPSYRIHKFKKGFSPVNIQIVRQHRYICNSFTNSILEIQKFQMTGSRVLKSKLLNLIGNH